VITALIYYFAVPLVLTTKVTHLRSLLFRQQDGVKGSSGVRKYFSARTKF